MKAGAKAVFDGRRMPTHRKKPSPTGYTFEKLPSSAVLPLGDAASSTHRLSWPN